MLDFLQQAWHVLRPILGLASIAIAIRLIWDVTKIRVNLALAAEEAEDTVTVDVNPGKSGSRALGALCVLIVAYELIQRFPDFVSVTWQLVIASSLILFVVWHGAKAVRAVWPALRETLANPLHKITVKAWQVVWGTLPLAGALVFLGGAGWLLTGSDFGWL